MGWGCERMPEFLVSRELILHSPLMQSVCLLPIVRFFFFVGKRSEKSSDSRRNVPSPLLFFLRYCKMQYMHWGYGSVGRATGSQSVGRRFDPGYLHF